MPRIVGVIAEYNPFHLGHAYHLQAAREAAGADYVVVVMSTCFTQRGDAALLSPRDRAEMALSCGADAVFALPAVWAVRDAEHFALGGTAVLNALGCNALSFGSEHADVATLMEAARLLEAPDEDFARFLEERITGGVSFPAAVAASADSILPGAGELLAQPNSTLAICYLRALLRLGSHMEAVPVPRMTSYHATALSGALPSATALRSAILRGDWRGAEASMPEAAFAILCRAAAEGRLHRPEALDMPLLARLRTMSSADYAALPDLSEGLEYRLRSAAQTACTRANLMKLAKTRRYPFARLSRLATHALLGFTGEDLARLPLPTPWLLGYRQEAKPLISLLAGRTRILARSGDLDPAEGWFAAESHAYDLWALGGGLPAGLARSQGIALL